VPVITRPLEETSCSRCARPLWRPRRAASWCACGQYVPAGSGPVPRAEWARDLECLVALRPLTLEYMRNMLDREVTRARAPLQQFIADVRRMP
jgi:hypothetical protein